MRLNIVTFPDSEEHEEELAFIEEWLKVHKDQLTHLQKTGCGCCVVDWFIEGPDEILGTIPHTMRMSSNWTRYEPPYDK